MTGFFQSVAHRILQHLIALLSLGLAASLIGKLITLGLQKVDQGFTALTNLSLLNFALSLLSVGFIAALCALHLCAAWKIIEGDEKTLLQKLWLKVTLATGPLFWGLGLAALFGEWGSQDKLYVIFLTLTALIIFYYLRYCEKASHPYSYVNYLVLLIIGSIYAYVIPSSGQYSQFELMADKCPLAQPCPVFTLQLKNMGSTEDLLTPILDKISVKHLKIYEASEIPTSIPRIAGLTELEIYNSGTEVPHWKSANLGEIKRLVIHGTQPDMGWIPRAEKLESIYISLSLPKEMEEYYLNLDFNNHRELHQLILDVNKKVRLPYALDNLPNLEKIRINNKLILDKPLK